MAQMAAARMGYAAARRTIPYLFKRARKYPFLSGMTVGGVAESLRPRKRRKQSKPKRFVPKSKRGAAPKFAIGNYGGRFKKRRAYKKVRKPTQGNTDTVYGQLVGQEAVYGGWSTCGGRDHAILQFSEQLLRQVMYERKLDIPGRDDPLPFTTSTADTLRLLYRTMNVDGTFVDAHDDVPITASGTTKTFDVVAQEIKSMLATALTQNLRYLYGYELKCNGEVMVARHQVDTWKFSMQVGTNFKVQNITPADDAAGSDDNRVAYSKDSILSNPLSGRQYEFSPGYPRIRPKIKDAEALAVLADESEVHGLVRFPVKTDAVYNPGGVLHVPPPGGTIFQNCVKGSSIAISPGNYKMLRSAFTFSGTVKQFCHKLHQNNANASSRGWARMTLGNTVCFGLAPTMRTTAQETVHIAYQKDMLSKAQLKPKYKCRLPRSNISNLHDVGTS